MAEGSGPVLKIVMVLHFFRALGPYSDYPHTSDFSLGTGRGFVYKNNPSCSSASNQVSIFQLWALTNSGLSWWTRVYYTLQKNWGVNDYHSLSEFYSKFTN